MSVNATINAINGTMAPPEIPITSKAIVIVIGILSVVFNGVLLLVMTLNAKQVFASLGSYFIANLAIADLITGINAILWGLYVLVIPNNKTLHKVLLHTFWIAVQVSFYTIFVMSTERLMAIVFPFRASLIMSKKKTIIYCFLVWLVAIVVSGSNHGDVNQVDRFWFAVIVIFEVLIIVIAIEYVFVFRQLRALWLQSRTRIVYNNTNTETATICNNNNNNKHSSQANDVKREYQATIVVICLAVILIVTVLPYNIATQAYISCSLFTSCSEETLKAVGDFMWFYFPIELLNFFLNPVVYAWRLPKYRNAFLVTFRLKKRESRCSSFTGKTQHSMLSRGGSARGMIPSC